MAIEYSYPPGKAAFARQVAAIAEFNGRSLAPLIRAKTLMLAGKEDLLFDVEEYTELARAIAEARIEALDCVAHSIPTEAPRVFADSVVEFLSH